MPTSICAVVFDMDGLIIDTEPIWREAEIEVFEEVGIHLTEEQCLETMGVPILKAVEIWHNRRPWHGPSIEQVSDRIEDAVVEHVRREGEPRPGVMESFDLFQRAGLPMAIASSSSMRLIRAVVDRLHLDGYVGVLCTADHEERGKPHPDVYLTAARRLGVPPETCLALEDSPNGVLSAKAAGMLCVAVPDPLLASDARFDAADLRLGSMTELDAVVLQELGERLTAP